MARVSDLLATRAREVFVGRQKAMAFLRGCLLGDAPLVAYVHGIAGIGKSTLLAAFAREARGEGAAVVRLDCRAIEPTQPGFLAALSTGLGAAAPTLDAIDERVQALGGRVLVLLDTYEVVPYLDSWLRQVFVPSLSADVRFVIASRLPPTPAWRTAPEWRGLFSELALSPLSSEEALDLLKRLGVGEEQARHTNRFARGHPLVLTLAALAVTSGATGDLEGAGLTRVVSEVTRVYLSQAEDPMTRRVLEAASIVRRVTRSLIGAMVPELAPDDAIERLRGLPFVSLGPDGLLVHDAVREAVAATLRAEDPARYRDLRRAAWRLLRQEVAAAPPADLWRYTADLLYMIEDASVHEAFFPSASPEVSVEPARPSHFRAVEAIARRHEGPESAGYIMQWWRLAPRAFHVCLDANHGVVGFYAMLDAREVPPQLARVDPVSAAWMARLRRHALSPDNVALLVRVWLSREEGPSPSPAQAAIWLDIKRLYMSLRPRLRRVYMAPLPDLTPYAEAAQRLGFLPLDLPAISMDGQAYTLAMLDMGPQSVDGWLARLVAAEIGVHDEDTLDADAHELVVEGGRVPLTRLEYSLYSCLAERRGRVVSHRELLQRVWGYEHTGATNVVAVAVRALRRKLGPRAAQVESVRGVGYRLRAADP